MKKRSKTTKKPVTAIALRKPAKKAKRSKKKPVTALAAMNVHRRRARQAKKSAPRNVTRTPKSRADRLEIIKLPDGSDPKRHLIVDKLLRELVTKMTQMQFEFTALAQETLTDRLYVRHHYQDPDEYFEQRIGFNYRSLRRRLTIEDAFRRLEGAERAECRLALTELGIHRAAILAPTIGKAGQDWRVWVPKARKMDEDALQAAVSVALGSKKRGLAAKKGSTTGATENLAHDGSPDLLPVGERWLNFTLSVLPEDARDEVEDVFGAGLYVTGHPDKIPQLQVFLALVRSAKVEWEHEALAAGWVPKHGEHVAPVEVGA